MRQAALIDWILARRRAVIALYALMALAALPGLFRLEQDNSAEVFFVRDATELARHRRFQMDFGRDRLVRLVVDGEGLWTAEGLAWLGRLERQAREVPGVFGVAGLFHRYHRGLGSWPPREPAAFRAEVGDDPLAQATGWITDDGAASALVALYNLPPEAERVVLDRLEDLLETAPLDLSTSMVGLPVLQRTFDREMIRFILYVFPLLFVLVSVLLWWVLRDVGDVLRLLLLVGVVQVMVLGLFGGLDLRLNMISILLLPLLFVISLATAVHVLLRFRQKRRAGLAPGEAVRATYREKGWPVFWTGVTTMAGFGSLAVSDVPPIRSLGLWTAAGIALLTVAAFSLYPALLAAARGAPRALGHFDIGAARRGRRTAEWAVARRRWVLVLFAGGALAGLAGLFGLHQETSLRSYLSPGHAVRQGMDEMERRGVGTVTAELVLGPRDGSGEPPFATVASLERVGALAEELRRVPGVLGVLSAGDLLASTRRRHPRDPPLERLLGDDETRDFLATLRTRDGAKARVAVMIPLDGFRDLEPIFDAIRRRAGEAFPEMNVTLTGRYPLVLAAQRDLLRTMVWSLLLTVTVVAATFWWVLGSPVLGLVAMVPNLWPIVWVLGTMGWVGVAVDSTTLMIAAVVLGLAVDDTFHTFGRFRLEVGRASQRAVATMEDIAPAHVLSSTLLVLGFGVCAVTDFLPVARFGLLAAWGIVSALAADLLLVPALLSSVSRPRDDVGTAGSSGPGSPRTDRVPKPPR